MLVLYGHCPNNLRPPSSVKQENLKKKNAPNHPGKPLYPVTWALEDANSKLVDVVTVADVADVDAEERVDDTLVEILKWVLYLVFGYKVEAEA